MLADGRGADERRDVLRDAALLEFVQILRQRRPGDLVLEVAHLLEARFFISGVSGPIELPSPKICVVTPWRSSPCERPSTSSDSVDHESMLMNPGATARPVASTTVVAGDARQVADAGDAIAADADVGRRPGAPVPS